MISGTRLFRVLYQFPKHLSYNERYDYVVYNYIFTFSLIGHITYLPIFLYVGNELVVVNNIICIGLDLICLWLNTHSHVRSSIMLWIAEICYHASACSVALGWEQGYYFYHISLGGTIFLTKRNLFTKTCISSALFLIMGALNEYAHLYPPHTATTVTTNKILFYSNALACFSALGFIGYSHHRVTAAQQHELRHQATHDMLTGILNRPALIENLSREINRSRRMNTPFSIIMCDLDFFKKINDTWGHLVGDYVLVRATQVLLENLRPYDCIARYGGEEFVIILPECDKEQARSVAERLRAGIEGSRVKFENSTIHFTMSFGVTTIKADETSSIEEVLTIADRALYRAKDNGRNCVDCA